MASLLARFRQERTTKAPELNESRRVKLGNDELDWLSRDMFQVLRAVWHREFSRTESNLESFLAPICGLITLRLAAHGLCAEIFGAPDPFVEKLIPPETHMVSPDELDRLTSNLRAWVAQRVQLQDKKRSSSLLTHVAEALVPALRDRRTFVELVRAVGTLRVSSDFERRAVLGAIDSVIERYLLKTPKSKRELAQHYTSPHIAEVMRGVCDIRPGNSVYDPSFGLGSLLTAVAREQVTGATLYGLENHQSAFIVGLTRILLAQKDDVRLMCEDALAEADPSSQLPFPRYFDRILVVPPYGLRVSPDAATRVEFPTRNSETLFLQHVMARLAPNGRAVVAISQGPLFRTGPDRKVRRALIDGFDVEGVIELPQSAAYPVSSPSTNLIVFSKRKPRSYISFFQASSPRESADMTRGPSDPEALRQVFSAVLHGRDLDGLRFQTVDTPSLNKDSTPAGSPSDRPLYATHVAGTPSRGEFVAAPSNWMWQVSVQDLARKGHELLVKKPDPALFEQHLEFLRQELADLEVAVLPTVATVIGGLRRVEYQRQSAKAPQEGVRVLRAADLAKRRGARVRPSLILPKGSMVGLRPSNLIQEGDILLATEGDIGVAVSASESSLIGVIAGTGITILRPRESVLPEFLLAVIRSPQCQQWLSAESVGGTIRRLPPVRLNRLKVPVVPIPVQEHVSRQAGRFGDVLVALQGYGSARGGPAGPSDSPLERKGADQKNKRIPLDIGAWLEEDQAKNIIQQQDSGGTLDALDHLSRQIRRLLIRLEKEPGDTVPSLRAWTTAAERFTRVVSGISVCPPGDAQLLRLIQAEDLSVSLSGLISESPALERISERASELTKEALAKAKETPALSISVTPGEACLGSDNDFQVHFYNPGHLTVHFVRVASISTLESYELSTLPSKEHHAMALRIHRSEVEAAHDRGEELSLLFEWACMRADGHEMTGVQQIQLPIRRAKVEKPPAELGPSPYIEGKPVKREEMFFGRADILKKIQRQLNAETHSNVIILEGNRRTGKTSVLMRILRGDLLKNWVPVFFDFQKLGQTDGLGTSNIYKGIALAIARALAKRGIEIWPPGTTLGHGDDPYRERIRPALAKAFQSDTPFEVFEEILEQALEAIYPERLLLMLDEFDWLDEGIRAGIASPEVPENLRHLLQHVPGLNAILTGSLRLARLREDHWSPLFGLGYAIRVSMLDPADARQLVTEPVKGRLTYVTEARDEVVEKCAAHPFLIQGLCNRVFDLADETGKRVVDLSMVEDAAREFVTSNTQFVTNWNSVETHRQRAILAICQKAEMEGDNVSLRYLEDALEERGVQVLSTSDLADDLASLRELELIRLIPSTQSYRLFVPLFARWIADSVDFSEVITRAREEAT